MEESIKKNLSRIFEDEVVSEIEKCEIREMEANFQMHSIEDSINYVPIVLSGSIMVFRIGVKGEEIPIYYINDSQSCAISFNNSYNSVSNQAYFKTLEKTKVALIPSETSNLWFDKYKSWRNFVMKMFNERLNDLVKQLDVTSIQKDEIQLQSNKITESIRYAQRIQQAVLPSGKFIEDPGFQHFVFFKPRDIVSGDFYWMMKENDIFIIAAADATGHGVPGAFMSMLGIAFLNEIKETSEQHNFKPALILDRLRDKVKTSLNQTGKDGEAKDGMDIAFCAIDLKNKTLQYSGAHNPLYLVKPGKNEVIELKADPQPIGIHLKEKPFTNHETKIEEGDMFYIFSDGFIDQFGGEKGNKYKSKRFKDFLISVKNEDFEKQGEIFENEFLTWKGELEQVDDVMVLGFKF